MGDRKRSRSYNKKDSWLAGEDRLDGKNGDVVRLRVQRLVLLGLLGFLLFAAGRACSLILFLLLLFFGFLFRMIFVAGRRKMGVII